MKPSEMLRVLDILRAGYADLDVKKDTAELYATMLADLDFEAVKIAIVDHISTSKWFPKISEIRERVAKKKLGALATAEEAWGEVKRAISKHGWYREAAALESLRPLTRAAVKIFGWKALCEGENPEADRAHFYRTYASIATRKLEGETLGRPVEIEGESQPERPQIAAGPPHQFASNDESMAMVRDLAAKFEVE